MMTGAEFPRHDQYPPILTRAFGDLSAPKMQIVALAWALKQGELSLEKSRVPTPEANGACSQLILMPLLRCAYLLVHLEKRFVSGEYGEEFGIAARHVLRT